MTTTNSAPSVPRIPVEDFFRNSERTGYQISPDGRVAGIRGDVDIDVFNGTKEQFEEYKRRERVSKSFW